jgi:hypothetical protein
MRPFTIELHNPISVFLKLIVCCRWRSFTWGKLVIDYFLLVKDFEEALGLILLGHLYSQMQVSVFQKAAARHYLFGVCVLVHMDIYRLFLLHLVTCVSTRWFCVCMTIMNHITFSIPNIRLCSQSSCRSSRFCSRTSQDALCLVPAE